MWLYCYFAVFADFVLLDFTSVDFAAFPDLTLCDFATFPVLAPFDFTAADLVDFEVPDSLEDAFRPFVAADFPVLVFPASSLVAEPESESEISS